MQRLGMLKLIISHSYGIPLSSLSSISATLERVLSGTVVVESEILDRAYFSKDLIGKITKTRGGEHARIELQDLYLSNPQIPSARGRLGTPDDFRRFPQFAVALNLIRPDTGALLARGHLIKEVTPQEEIDSFQRYSEVVNPFILTRSQALVFLLTILEADSSVLPSLYKGLPKPNAAFNDMQAGDLLPKVLTDAIVDIPTKNLSTSDLARLKDIRATADAIKAREGERFGKTVREQNITPRLEPLVDIGVLKKSDPRSYEYEITTNGAEFIKGITSGCTVQSNLSDKFFSLALKLFGLRLKELPELDIRLAYLYMAWSRLHNATRYSTVDETGILASIMAIEQGAGYIESTTVWSSLYQAREIYSELLRFGGDRNGKINSLRFLREPDLVNIK